VPNYLGSPFYPPDPAFPDAYGHSLPLPPTTTPSAVGLRIVRMILAVTPQES
jgi:hypothetical protein